MEKRILVGSIIAVAILILVSFTGVVGYQTTKSSTIAIASPLFSIRTSRAIDEESKGLTCDYVGKGEENNIHLSSRIKRAEQIQKAVDIISKMDDKSFDRFVKIVIANINQEKKINDIKLVNEEIAFILFQLRDNSEVIKNNFKIIKDKDWGVPTLGLHAPVCQLYWLIILLIGTIINVIIFPFAVLCWLFPNIFPNYYLNSVKPF